MMSGFKGESSKQGKKKAKMDKVSLYGALTRNTNAGVHISERGSMPNASRPSHLPRRGNSIGDNYLEGSMPNASRPGRHVSYNIEVDSSQLPRRGKSIGDDHLEDSRSASEAEMEDMDSVDDFQRDGLAQVDHRGDFARVSSSTSGFRAYQSSKDPSGECKGK